MSEKKAVALSRSEMFKRLRAEHAESVERTQELVREQTRMQREICSCISGTPGTVPEIAEKIGKATHEVLWYVAALKKYGLVVEAGMRGEYPLYQWIERTQL
jgi:predicted transcriptional regulator